MSKIKQFWIFYFIGVGSAFVSAALGNLWILIITAISLIIQIKIINNLDE